MTFLLFIFVLVIYLFINSYLQMNADTFKNDSRLIYLTRFALHTDNSQ